MKSGKPTSPFLFTFYSHFAAIHRASRYIFVTAEKRLPVAQEVAGLSPVAPAILVRRFAVEAHGDNHPPFMKSL